MCTHDFQRDLDRERAKLEQQEKKVIADIKKMAKAGQMVTRLIHKLKLILPRIEMLLSWR